MKHIFLKVVFLSLLLFSEIEALAVDVEIGGINYSLDNNNSAVVRSRTKGYSGNIVIPASITYNGKIYNVIAIGARAFRNCNNLNSITIPSSIKAINNDAFSGCGGLSWVQISDLKGWIDMQIESNPLYYARHLYLNGNEIKDLVVPDGVTTINKGVFERCNSFVSVKIPNCVTTIGANAFRDCESLETVTLSASVKDICENAFLNCERLENVSFPENVILYPSSFENCGFKEIKLSKSIKISSLNYGETSGYIPRTGTFCNCKKLEYAYIDCNADQNLIFDNCEKLEKIEVGPNGILWLGYLKMCNMPSLKFIEVEKGSQRGMCSQDNILYYDTNYFGEDGRVLVGVANAKEGTVVIPNGVIGIYDYAFNRCSKISSVILPQSVHRIERYAFANCGIKSIEIPSTIQELGHSIFSKDTVDVYLYGNPKLYTRQNHTFVGMGKGSRLFAFSGILKPENKMTTYSPMPQFTPFDKPSIVTRPTSITIKDIKLSNIDDEITGYYFDNTKNATLDGLDPDTENGVVYYMKTKKHGIAEGYYSCKTPSLKLTTAKPKVTNKGEAVVCATTNMDDAETHAGFEWRKTDAPDVVESRQGGAVIYNGTMEGKIKNLDTSAYWKVRAYYKSNSGKMYYGDWIGFDPNDFSYFEPTVHTYSSPEVNGTSVTLAGAAVEGTDEIQEQGFEYWSGSANTRESRAPSNVQRVTANTGQRMTATITDLSNDTYTYRSYVKTEKGTFYGEEQKFTITAGSSGSDGGGNETKTLNITTSKAGYATFYDSQESYTLPTGLTAQVVTGVANDKLNYETIGNTIPKGVAVVLKGSTKAEVSYDLTTTSSASSYSGTNLLNGSDVATTTIGDGYHYKLSYGQSGSPQNSVFGWYWGAKNGAAFQIEAHKAWLVLPRSAAARSYSIDDETTDIQTVDDDGPTNDNYWYDLQGRRVSEPTVKGIYLNNGKKIMVK